VLSHQTLHEPSINPYLLRYHSQPYLVSVRDTTTHVAYWKCYR
jgi:hypothetical protein